MLGRAANFDAVIVRRLGALIFFGRFPAVSVITVGFCLCLSRFLAALLLLSWYTLECRQLWLRGVDIFDIMRRPHCGPMGDYTRWFGFADPCCDFTFTVRFGLTFLITCLACSIAVVIVLIYSRLLSALFAWV